MMLVTKSSARGPGEVFVGWGRGEEIIKGDFSEEAVFKLALKNGQGFTRQRLGVQRGMLEAQGPG